MNPFDIMGFVAGLVLVYRAGAHIEAMSARSDHFVRLAYYLIAVGGGALVITPMSHEPWISQLGLAFAVCGTALLLAFDRRRAVDEQEHVRGYITRVDP